MTLPSHPEVTVPQWLPSLCQRVFLAALISLCPALAIAQTATVAVAANFLTTLEKLGARFGAAGGHDIRIVSGSTGKLYTQIVRGAPFDIFLAADTARPARLVTEGMAQDHRTYAIGRLVLWSRKGDASEETLRGGIDRLAIANPDLAPYGAAAMETLQHFGLTGADEPTIVMGENVGQAIAMLATGNVDYGLVPLSIRTNAALGKSENLWPIPATAHAPIRQDAVLLARGADNAAAVAFFAFLASDTARAIILADGYEPDDAP